MKPGAEAAVVLEDVQIKLVKPGAPVIGRVVSNELCMNGKSASYIKHTTFDVSGTPLAGAFRAGQSFGVIPPGVDDDGKPHKVRLYSLACPSWGEDGGGQIISTTPKRLVEEFVAQKPADDASDHHLFMGVCSNYLCDLKPGDEVRLTGPNGKRFQLPRDRNAHDYLFLATGTGIAPFRGMVMELFEHADGATSSEVRLVMGSPYTTDLLYNEQLEGYADSYRNFHYHRAISREPRVDGRGGQYVHELVDERIDEFRELLASPRTLIYVCGLAGMQDGLFDTLARHGLDAAYCVHGERGVKPTQRCMLEVY